MNCMKKTSTLFTILLFFSITTLQAQTAQVEFGKNRIQYVPFFWKEYPSENFVTYFHQSGRELVQFASLVAEAELPTMQNLLEHRMGEKIDLIVYNDLNSFKQSNIGSEETFTNTGGIVKTVKNTIFVYFDGNHAHLRRDIREGIARVVLADMLVGDDIPEIVQNAVLLHLPGWFTDGLSSYAGQDWNEELDDQLRIYYAENATPFDDLLAKNPKLAGHAFWYYVAQNYGKSTVSNLLYLTRINRSVETGMLYVLGSSYAQTTESLTDFYYQRYGEDIKNRQNPKDVVSLKIKSKYGEFQQGKLSPDGSKLLYVTNNIGRARVWISDSKGKKPELIWRKGYRNPFQSTDPDYPVVAWSHSGKIVTIIYEERGQIWFESIDLTTKKREKDYFPAEIQRISSLEYLNNDNEAVMSGTQDGYSDLFLYRFSGRKIINITRDHYDDLEPTYYNYKGKRGVLFASNRPITEVKLPKTDSLLMLKSHLDIFFINIEEAPFKVWRATNTPDVDEHSPVALDDEKYLILSNANGIANQYLGNFQNIKVGEKRIAHYKNKRKVEITSDSMFNKIAKNDIDSIHYEPVYEMIGVNIPVSNFPQSIYNQSVVKDQIAEKVINSQGKFALRVRPFKLESATTPKATTYKNIIDAIGKTDKKRINTGSEIKNPKDIKKEQVNNVPKDTSKIDIDNYAFQSEFEEPAVSNSSNTTILIKNPDGSLTVSKPIIEPSREKKDGVAANGFKQTGIRNSFLRFRTEYWRTTLDNSPFFGGIEPRFEGDEPMLPQTPMGLLASGSIKDQFEDKTINCGVRFPVSFTGSEWFINYADREKRTDKIYSAYYRINNTKSILPSTSSSSLPEIGDKRTTTSLAQVEWRYPFDVFTSLRGKLYGRVDSRYWLPLSRSILEDDQSATLQSVGGRAEYVFDNTLDVMPNIKNGTRIKFFAEAIKTVEVSLDFQNPKFNLGKGFTGVIGFDARHYEPVFGKSILAFRAAASSSFGSNRFLYYIGGTDNGFAINFTNDFRQTINSDIPITDPAAVYQATAPSLRGFFANVRNGNSYLLGSAELRVPLAWYFTKQPPKSSFWRGFEMIAFIDAGSAWVGLSPFEKDNPINTSYIYNTTDPNNATVQVKVNYFRDPFVFGYGGGIRFPLGGYLMRLDIAQGVETGVLQTPTVHISMGVDF